MSQISLALLHRKTGIDISAAHVDAIRKGANYLHSSFPCLMACASRTKLRVNHLGERRHEF